MTDKEREVTEKALDGFKNYIANLNNSEMILNENSIYIKLLRDSYESMIEELEENLRIG